MKIALLAAAATLAIGVGGFPAQSMPHPDAPPRAPMQEPYGGCDEAYLFPDSEGARLCGWEQVSQELRQTFADAFGCYSPVCLDTASRGMVRSRHDDQPFKLRSRIDTGGTIKVQATARRRGCPCLNQDGQHARRRFGCTEVADTS